MEAQGREGPRTRATDIIQGLSPRITLRGHLPDTRPKEVPGRCHLGSANPRGQLILYVPLRPTSTWHPLVTPPRQLHGGSMEYSSENQPYTSINRGRGSPLTHTTLEASLPLHSCNFFFVVFRARLNLCRRSCTSQNCLVRPISLAPLWPCSQSILLFL
jgi:hypothetical protein